ncbi:hypothetical protein CHS0354_019798 [Potamilus streckersoni]|uniref:DZIP3-like HEPN domain-containing protein n=1 Tax=Potamilus streckersoni TaxID=2493646 RepID=A0AAE0W2Z7_9BIVA|nr:hypothetical protein CHS0354_019798 [Potamilus streckersoni]
MEEQGIIYVNAAAAEVPSYQNPGQLGTNNEQTFEWNRGNNPNQHQHLIDTSVTHPPTGTGLYGPGWGQYPHPNQGYPGQYGFQQPGSGQSTYVNQDRNPQNPHLPNPSQFPHASWYGPGFPPYFQPGMGYPSPCGMHDGKDQQVPLQFYSWGLMPPPPRVQMPNTSEAGPGIGHLNQQAPWFPANFGPQNSPQLQYGPPSPHESGSGSCNKDGSNLTEVKSALFDTRSDDSNKDTKLPLSMTTKSPSKQEMVSPEDVVTEDEDEFPEIKKQEQEGQGRTSGEMSEKNKPFSMVKKNEQDEPIRKIKVTKLPDETTEDMLMNYFENRRRNGGGPIENIELHQVTSSAIIEFQEADAPCTSKDAERENFNRISCLLVDIGTQVLRRLLYFYAVTRDCTLVEFLKNNEKDIRDLRKKTILTKPQLDEIFPITGTTDSRKYDISLTSALLLNVVKNLDPQVERAIKDVKNDRNLYQAHASSARMNSSDFSTHWTRISKNLIYLCRCCRDPDFEDHISEEIKRIKQSGLQALQTRINMY